MSEPILVAQGLERRYRRACALDGVSVSISAGDSLAIVGESGCGKSTLLRCLAGLERAEAGSVYFGGAEVSQLQGEDRKRFCRSVQLVLQDATRALNPWWSGLTLVREPLDLLRRDLSMPQRETVARCWMDRVGLPASVVERLPGELSGGQRQRLLLARAMTLSPSVLLLDEPLAGLDPPIQAAILELLKGLRSERPLATVLVTHSLGAAAQGAERIVVMRSGRLVEQQTMTAFLAGPQDPYSREILAGWQARQANIVKSPPIKSSGSAH
jgi:peptide/nickel transport system ATP-binding protein